MALGCIYICSCYCDDCAPAPTEWEYNTLTTVVCPSVLCLTLSREVKGVGSWKLTAWKPMKRVTRDPIYRSKGQRTRSPGRLTPWPKSSHISSQRQGPVRTSNLVYERSTMTHITDVGGDLQAQRYGPLFVTTCRGRRHSVAAPQQAAQLVYSVSPFGTTKIFSMDFTTVSQDTSFHTKTSICVITATVWRYLQRCGYIDLKYGS